MDFRFWIWDLSPGHKGVFVGRKKYYLSQLGIMPAKMPAVQERGNPKLPDILQPGAICGKCGCRLKQVANRESPLKSPLNSDPP
ncbi:MAG: hypothetical protein KME26_03965 [Oscillatoria princeps RMCB-10]|jgi:hypothetical protein|nr:hypothetical protein [Oscillatoria princeps RMCB-10]